MKILVMFLSLTVIMSLPLTACNIESYDEGYEVGFQQGYEEGWEKGFQAGKEESAATVASLPQPIESTDKSRYTEDEICASIWNRLPYELPDEYEIEQFDVETRTAEYLSNKKWKFEVYGSGEDRITAPKTTEEKSDVLWIERIKEKVITYDLRLQADFFESGGILEITQIDKLNKQSSLETVSETTLHARLEVTYLIDETDGARYFFEGEVLNIGSIPLHDVTIRTMWSEFDIYKDNGEIVLVKEAPIYTEIMVGEPYAGYILPSETAHFKIDFLDKRDLMWDIEFLSSSGNIIPFEFSEELLDRWLRGL